MSEEMAQVTVRSRALNKLAEQDDERVVYVTREQAGYVVAMGALGEDQTQKSRDLVLLWIHLASEKGLPRTTANQFAHAVGKLNRFSKIKKITSTLGRYVTATEMMTAAGVKFKKQKGQTVPVPILSPFPFSFPQRLPLVESLGLASPEVGLSRPLARSILLTPDK